MCAYNCGAGHVCVCNYELVCHCPSICMHMIVAKRVCLCRCSMCRLVHRAKGMHRAVVAENTEGCFSLQGALQPHTHTHTSGHTQKWEPCTFLPSIVIFSSLFYYFLIAYIGACHFGSNRHVHCQHTHTHSHKHTHKHTDINLRWQITVAEDPHRALIESGTLESKYWLIYCS